MTAPHFVILGCGFTGSRVAERLLVRGLRVFVVSRSPEKLTRLRAFGADIREWNLDEPAKLPEFPGNATVLHSVPEISDAHRFTLRAYLLRLYPARVVYLSTTGVYGAHAVVDAATAVAPNDEKNTRRVEEEQFVLNGHWNGAVLRPAAIYGPNRGVHTHLRAGKAPRARSGIVSRIHVDDLAAHAEAALLSDWLGALPVADDHPCSSEEIAVYCRQILNLAMSQASEAPIDISGRSVDGSEIRRVLGLELRYPSYHSGVLASIASEA